MTIQNSGLDRRNALIIKIALFLNFLSKDDCKRLFNDIKQHGYSADVDVLKIMAAKNYLASKDLPLLKKICLSFAKSQADKRFGSLALEFDFITQSNLDLALEEQKQLMKNGSSIRIGDLLVNAGMLSPRQRNLILQKQKIENAGRADGVNGNWANGTCDEGTQDTEAEFNPAHMREFRESDIIFYIREDALKAYMKKTEKFDKGMQPADLKFLLERIGIIYGVVDDSQLTDFIQLPEYDHTVFQVAAGQAPIDGTDARIVCLFERDYLKAGSLSEDGTIDFKDRGSIPFVAQGDVLAKKIPLKEGKDGINIYGDIIPKTDALDVSFILGKGVRLSKDESQAIASAEGNPKVNQSGELSVNTACFIEGDVDYTTGHIKFNKNVYISGTIKSGFKVEAIDVVAGTIDGGIVKAQGDVFIQNGATDSEIHANGDIKAGFMHRSRAVCMGDMSVVKEIVDTDIRVGGIFDMSKGKIYTSDICAKGGAQIYAIGSEKAKPSDVSVGVSRYLREAFETMDRAIEQRQHLLEKRIVDKNKAEAEMTVIDKTLENAGRSGERPLTMAQEIENNGHDAFLEDSLFEAEQKIHDLKSRKALLEARLKKVETDITIHTDAVKAAVKDKFTLKRLDQKNPPRPILDISGTAFAGTKISGKHAFIVLKNNISRARIMEMNSSRDNTAGSNWEMVITPL